MMMRRRGMPIARLAVGTAVVAGTAGAVSHHQQQKYANQQASQDAQQQAAYEAGVEAAQQQAMAQQQAAAQAAPVQAAPASPQIDMEQLKQLGDLHAAGVLTDEEFAAAKAKLLAGG
jgi:uncharacterized protein HemX